ncbi:DUF3458 domain-containing protein, partial [Shewanella sp. 0m-11]
NFTDKQQTFTFSGMTSKPIPSLLQNFSAPVKLSFDYSIEQLVHIMRFATSEVAKWEASVSLFSQSVWQNVERLQHKQAMFIDPRILDAFKGVILAQDLDKALMAEILTLPSAGSLIEQKSAVDLDNLALAREFVVLEIASDGEDELLAKVRELSSIDEAAARSLKNICLSLLLKIEKSYGEVAKSQFDSADNMTDSLGALSALNCESSAIRNELMRKFEQEWIDTPLVMDKWFALHATLNSHDCIEKLQSLFEHQAFSFNNPNRVRSLIGAFAAGNTLEFHRKDGQGYQFLADAIIKLNKLNPQVAARIITPLIQFKKFDNQRQALMKNELQRILEIKALSKDLYEKVTKALV